MFFLHKKIILFGFLRVISIEPDALVPALHPLLEGLGEVLLGDAMDHPVPVGFDAVAIDVITREESFLTIGNKKKSAGARSGD